MIRYQLPRLWKRWWRRWWKRVLWLGGILVVLLIVQLLIRIGYAPSWTSFTGFGSHKVKEHVQPAKTLWDWLDLLIIPIVLAIGGYLFTRSENRTTQAAAERRALDDTLQAYLDGMSQLLTDKELPLHSAQPGDSLSTVARARTLTVLTRLDGERKASVVQFLFESELIYREQILPFEGGLIKRQHNIVSLDQANLSEAYLSNTDLSGADLGGANLTGADLGEANLTGADLGEANLTGANMSRVNLRASNLLKANLSYADLSVAYLGYANLGLAYLKGAYLSYADLSVAYLGYAKLSNARGITNEELHQQAHSLERATLPDGQKYEDWLENRRRQTAQWRAEF